MTLPLVLVPGLNNTAAVFDRRKPCPPSRTRSDAADPSNLADDSVPAPGFLR